MVFPTNQQLKIGGFIGLIKRILNKAWLKNVVHWLGQSVVNLVSLPAEITANLDVIKIKYIYHFVLWLTVYSL